MSTTVEILGAQHQEVLQELRKVESLLGDAAQHQAVAQFAAFLEGDVLAHFGIEEQALFPVLGRHLPPSGGPLAVMNAEHESFRDLLHGLGSAVRDGDGERERACARNIIDLLRAHIAKEDNVLFPMAMRLLSPDEQREVDALAAGIGSPAAAQG